MPHLHVMSTGEVSIWLTSECRSKLGVVLNQQSVVGFADHEFCVDCLDNTMFLWECTGQGGRRLPGVKGKCRLFLFDCKPSSSARRFLWPLQRA
jgi:hypothetical protein